MIFREFLVEKPPDIFNHYYFGVYFCGEPYHFRKKVAFVVSS